jgi:hypothetical protein
MKVLISALACVAIAGSAAGATLVSSTFDSDVDGWVAGQFIGGAWVAETPTSILSGGNPGGYIHIWDCAPWTAFYAPGKFLGNKSAGYGGILQFDLMIPESDPMLYSAVEISDGATTLQFREPFALGIWNRFTIPLVASAGWQISTDGKLAGTAATELELLNVLSNLQSLRINADWKTGLDVTELDNVALISTPPVPEPSTMILFGSALVAVSLLRRKRA